MSARRAGARCSGARRRSIARRKSGILDARNAIDGGHEFTPRPALRFEDAGARGREAVVAAAALAGLLDPAAVNPAAFFETVEQRIERRDAELEHAAGAQLDQLAEVITMPRLVFNEGEDQEFGAPLFQLAIEH